MAIVAILDKSCVGNAPKRPLLHRQFADLRIIIGQFRGAHLRQAGPALALTRAHRPAIAGCASSASARSRAKPSPSADAGANVSVLGRAR